MINPSMDKWRQKNRNKRQRAQDKWRQKQETAPKEETASPIAIATLSPTPSYLNPKPYTLEPKPQTLSHRPEP